MDAVGEVKARLSIEDVISEYVRLKRAGRNFKGLSPFTSEKTPSFVVSPEKQIWHDFSSGRGGDVFTFIQEVEGVDFKGALELLARKAGVELEDYRSGPKGRSGIDKERLYKVLELAAKFYQTQLKANQPALKYLLNTRAFSKQTVLDFQLGYSPNARRALSDFLTNKGFSDKELKLAGLISGNGGDMFRGRIMVPLHDSFGKVIGFTARLLEGGDSNGPKYINTPSTPLYDKSRHIYGLHLAKQAIRSKGFSVLVEGNLDVVSSHQAGQKQVVATAGTALTDYQLKALGRFSPDVRLSFDQDRAGLAAAERAIPIANKTGVNLSIITLPEGSDPDELVRKNPKLWETAIAGADYAVDWLINRYREKLDVSTAQGKRTFSDVMVELIKNLEDPVEQDHYVGVVSEITGVEADAIRRKLAGSTIESRPRLKKTTSSSNSPKDLNHISQIDKLLSLALMLPGTRVYLEFLSTEMLVTDNQRQFFTFIKQNPDFDGSPANLKKLFSSEQSFGEEMILKDYVKILSLLFEELYVAIDTLELQYEAQRLRAKIIEYFVNRRKIKLSENLQASDEAGQKDILSEVKDLDNLLSKVKKS